MIKPNRQIISIFLFFLSSMALAQSGNHKIEELIKLSSFTMGKDSVESLPIVYQKKSLPFLKVVINGKEYLFLFDTGSSASIVTKEIAENSVIKNVSTFYDAFEKKSKVNVVLQNIQIGNSSFDSILCVVSDIKLLSEIGCVKIDGVLGANLINLCNWRIDAEKKLMSFSSSAFKSEAINHYEFDIEFTDNSLPLLKLGYDDISFYCLVDFGYSGYLDLNEDILKKSEKIRRLNRIKGFGKYALSVNSTMEDKVVRLIVDTLRIGQDTLLDIPATLFDTKPQLGSLFLNRYIVILNPKHRKLILTPSKKEDSISFTYPLNFALNKTNNLVISYIWETEETRDKGLKIGQKVISIDEQIFTQLNNLDLCELKDKLNQKLKIKVVVEIGKKLKEFDLYKSIK